MDAEAHREWLAAADEADVHALEEGVALGVEVDGQSIALCPYEGDIYAVGDVCTHGAALLSDGYLDGPTIECPLHQGLFDIRDGQPKSAPVTEPVAAYDVKVEDGRVFVRLRL